MKMEISGSTKGQIYWMDYVLAFFMFLIILSIFITTLDNYNPQQDVSMSEIQREANYISKTLLLEGSPILWKAENYSRIGLRQDGKVSKQRLYEFFNLGYYAEKNSLRMKYDFALMFANGSKAIQNIGGICAIGKNASIDVINKIAYYYPVEPTGFIKGNVSDTLLGEIFDLSNQSAMFDSLENFTLLILDDPGFANGQGHTFAEKKGMIETFVSQGNNLILSGDPGGDMLGMIYPAVTGWNLTISADDPGFDAEHGRNITIAYGHLPNGACTGIGLAQNGLYGIARWQYGNGTVYYFANYTFSSQIGNMKNEMIKAIRYNIKGECGEILFDNVGEEMLIKVERLCLVEDKVMTMEVYSWI